MLTGDGSAIRRQLEDREAECRMLQERCSDLERLLAAEQAALQAVFAAGEESARIQMGLPVQRPNRRGHLRGLSAVVLFAMLAAAALHTAVHGGMRVHAGRRPSAAAAAVWGRTGVLCLAREETPARPL